MAGRQARFRKPLNTEKAIKKMTQKERRLWLTAYHEAGHAVAYFLLGFRIARVSVIPDEGSLGHVRGYKKSRRTLDFIETVGAFPDRAESAKIARWHDEVVCTLAGMEAVRLFMPGSKFRQGTHAGHLVTLKKPMFGLAAGTKVRFGAHGDVPSAFDILSRLHGDDEAQLVYRWLALRARSLVKHNFARPGIEALAKALVEKREMSGKETRKVIVEANRRRTSVLIAKHYPAGLPGIRCSAGG
jgi:hypothetical protein